MPDESRHEILIGLHVSNDDRYNQYRAGMTPILTEHGGFFRYDFRVNEQLKGDEDPSINRVFILSFPDEETKTRFFENETYKAVRSDHFDSSVELVSSIATFNHAQA